MDSRTGESITAAQAMNGVYIWEVPNPLYFRILSHLDRPFFRNHDIITIQIRFNHNLRRALGLHKCWLTFRIWTSLTPQTGRFLRVFRTQVLRYLDNLGVICINNVFKAVDHVLYNVINNTIDVEISHEIKFLLY
ncbi:replication enhancer protein [Clerodendron yellow mosaic virus]|uniref:Replication enhancer n=1 Tax=Clerodendron yellow mosaic virus TaxID=326811 RepID=A4ZS01_9GEMI|nr:replication enhancer protein [Clerodendron yellow mosaic virus]ABP58642.1 replication enhancer protein [Clerodendron yellow mosaic virus]